VATCEAPCDVATHGADRDVPGQGEGEACESLGSDFKMAAAACASVPPSPPPPAHSHRPARETALVSGQRPAPRRRRDRPPHTNTHPHPTPACRAEPLVASHRSARRCARRQTCKRAGW
jgi:hypothetical protein